MYIAPELAAFHDPAGAWVIHVGESPIDRREVARVLASVLDVPPYQVEPLVRNHVGCVLVKELRADLGEELVRRLAEVGMETRAISLERMVVPHFVGQAHHFAYTEVGIVYNVHGEEPEATVPWESVVLLAAGWVEMPKTGDAVTHERHLMANLFFAVQQGCQYLRLDSRHLPYAHLGERLLPSSVDNFRLVVEELVSHRPGVFMNPGVKLMHGGALLPPHPSFPGIAAFDEDHIGLLQTL